MQPSSAIDYYRTNPRVVQTLQWARCFPKKATASADEVALFVAQSGALRELEERLRRFNLFDALGVGEKEVRHSRLLGWLHDPRGTHRQGDRYLRLLWGSIARVQKDRRGVPVAVPKHVEVLCERDRIDLRLVDHSARLVCVIENKIRDDERAGQLGETASHAQRLYPRYERILVFLTLNHEPPSDPRYLAVDYATLLQPLFNERTKPTDFVLGRALLFSHYAATIRRRGAEGAGVNVLDVLHLGRTEMKHSDLIAYLLRPTGSHGLGDRFVRFVLRLLVEKGARLPIKLEAMNLDDLIVRREHESIDVFAVSERNRFVLVIENKLGAREHGLQLDNYHASVRRQYGGDHVVFAYLDLKQSIPSHADYLALSHEDLLPFFDRYAAQADQLTEVEQAAIICEHYLHLLSDLLNIKRKQTWTLPAGVQTLCAQIAVSHAKEGGTLLREVRRWQVAYGKRLEPFLRTLADRFFGPCLLHPVHDTGIWVTFIPAAFARFASLRAGGSNRWLGGWLAYYQFVVIPFGDTISVRKPGIKLDVKLGSAEPSYVGVKAKLHAMAMGNRMFNRVQKRICNDDPLLSHGLCAFEEALTCDDKEFRARLEHRVERFARSTHRDILEFLDEHLGRGGV